MKEISEGSADSMEAAAAISRSPLPSNGAFKSAAISLTFLRLNFRIIQGMPIDSTATVAETARVHAEAKIGPHCVIADYCVIEADVELGAFCRLEPYVYVKRWTT